MALIYCSERKSAISFFVSNIFSADMSVRHIQKQRDRDRPTNRMRERKVTDREDREKERERETRTEA